MTLRVVPELLCTNIYESSAYFVDVLGFRVKYERSEELFVYLSLGGVDLMLEGINPSERQWITGELDAPLGRGINFQWSVEDIDEVYSKVMRTAANTIYLPMESKEYVCGDKVIMQRQFIVQVPDGYLFRFCQE